MIERPLILFGEPRQAERDGLNGFPQKNKAHFPNHSGQIDRLNPKFNMLWKTVENDRLHFSDISSGIEPEYTLVFETVGNPERFYSAAKKLSGADNSFEWLAEFDSETEPDDDYYMCDKNNRKIDGENVCTKVFCVSSNQRALKEFKSLWDNYSNNSEVKFKRGYGGIKNLFSLLKDVRPWGVKERLEDTGVLEEWINAVEDDACESVRAEIELFFRHDKTKRVRVQESLSAMIKQQGGNVLCSSEIEEICYHALLVEIPIGCVKQVLESKNVDFVCTDSVMFVKPMSCMDIISSEAEPEVVEFESRGTIYNEPVVALFDGVPIQNHSMLNNMLLYDDPDDYEDGYLEKYRIHGTSMASLILHGIEMDASVKPFRKLYVRPIYTPNEYPGGDRAEEEIPKDRLIVDQIHLAVRRLFEDSAGKTAPSVRVINLSFGIKNMPYINTISPLARLLDWLSYKYRVLFIVSAGNHPEDVKIGYELREYEQFGNDVKNTKMIEFLSANKRNYRILSPAESINALTVGATYDDNSDAMSIPGRTVEISEKGLPALYGSFGAGINGTIKPEIFYPGGRAALTENMLHSGTLKWPKVPGKMGLLSASPDNDGGPNGYSFSYGTSNSAALISHEAMECYEILNEIFLGEIRENVPLSHAAVLLKAMLAHGSSWGEYSAMYKEALKLKGSTVKNTLHRYLGYGIPDMEKAKRCTAERITLIGYGDISPDDGYEYLLPVPIDFAKKTYKRWIRLTLASLSPVVPSRVSYRGLKVWASISADKKQIYGKRDEYYDKATQRGTLQHEVFSSEDIFPWDIDDGQIRIKVNCKADASEKKEKIYAPYAIFASFEMQPGCGIDVYERVATRIKQRARV